MGWELWGLIPPGVGGRSCGSCKLEVSCHFRGLSLMLWKDTSNREGMVSGDKIDQLCPRFHPQDGCRASCAHCCLPLSHTEPLAGRTLENLGRKGERTDKRCIFFFKKQENVRKIEGVLKCVCCCLTQVNPVAGHSALLIAS
ncbi:uncharacterized protein LOC100592149 isoform X1 [Nomascus leucogenys]|uniref:uncharacterized protein LOC100592149 isoform X1 n=1 Tax=Nomascus leucogenys TaxID=61853 RepID=UPI00122DA108|nr:uncharacterized protein LOC100592149 isoform X1 [Nomascus leucogenys]